MNQPILVSKIDHIWRTPHRYVYTKQINTLKYYVQTRTTHVGLYSYNDEPMDTYNLDENEISMTFNYNVIYKFLCEQVGHFILEEVQRSCCSQQEKITIPPTSEAAT